MSSKSGVKTGKSPKTKWSSDHIVTFLEVFQNYELLWNVRHSEYNNKLKRESAMLKLKEDLIAHGLIVPDMAFLRARIKTIKTTYRQELLKVCESKSSGRGVDDVYEPTLPWYSSADSFLKDVAVTRQSHSNLELVRKTSLHDIEDSASQQAHCTDDLPDDTNTNDNDNGDGDADDDDNDGGQALQNKPQDSNFTTPANYGKRTRLTRMAKVENALTKLKKISDSRSATSTKPDEYDIYASHIAGQLRKLPMRSFVILQEKIQSLITAEQLNCMAERSPLATYMATSPLISGHSSSCESYSELSPSENEVVTDGVITYMQLH